MLSGPMGAVAACEQTLTGGFVVPLVLIPDARPVFVAVTATLIKNPAGESLLCHVEFLRDLLDLFVLRMLIWFDTRGMCADGLTKGIVDRAAIQAVMDDAMSARHDTKTWTGRKGGRCSPEALPSARAMDGRCSPEVFHATQSTNFESLNFLYSHFRSQAIASPQRQKCQ